LQIVAYRPEHLSRILELTAEGFQGVSIDHLVEQRFGFIEPGWRERKLTDLRSAAEREPEGIFVAVKEGEVIGYITVSISRAKSLGRIADMVVDARFRRQGIGSKLIERALDYMREQGMRLAKIETLTNNEAGQAAYPKHGFVEVARQIHYVMPLQDTPAEK
jgi:ribosomal protein S18 acetylase RimI-like enzyme